MSSWADQSSGQYLNATLLAGKPDQTVVIETALVETVGQDDERKLVLRFRGKDRALIVNKTNGDTLADAFGDDFDEWVGQTITLFVIPNVYQGKPGLRIRPPVVQIDEEFSDDALSGSDELPF